MEKRVLVRHGTIALLFDYPGGTGFHLVSGLLELAGIQILKAAYRKQSHSTRSTLKARFEGWFG